MTSTLVNMNKVRELATAKLWTFAELARRSKVSDATLYSLQSKRRKASFLTIQKIATALEVQPNELIEHDTANTQE